MTIQTAVLIETLIRLGATVRWSSRNISRKATSPGISVSVIVISRRPQSASEMSASFLLDLAGTAK
jgi:S-adenosylhomocysteine hydrolase